MSEDMDAESENGEYDFSDSDNSSEYDDALEENTWVKTDAESLTCCEYDKVFDENTRAKVIANATDEENTSSDDAIGVGARNGISKKGKTYHFTNCTNVQVGEKPRMDIRRLGVIEKQCTALQQAIQEHKQEIHILREADTQQKQTIQEHQQAIHILQEADTEQKQTTQEHHHISKRLDFQIRTDAESQNCSEYDDVFDENTRAKVIANASDEENTSSDDAIGVGARKRISKKGNTYNYFKNCMNFQVGEKARMDIRRLGVIEKQYTALQQTIQEHKQEIHILREADTQHQQTIEEHQQTIEEHQQAIQILQDKVTGQQESIRKLEKSDVENKKIISGLQHSVNIQQEEIQSLKMKVNLNKSIESSPLTNVTNQSKDVKLSSDNLNEEVLSDETTPQNKTEEQLLEELYQRYMGDLRDATYVRDLGYISEEKYQRWLRSLANMRDRGVISKERYQELLRSLEDSRDKGYISEERYQERLRVLENARDKGYISEELYQECLRFMANRRYRGVISEEEYQRNLDVISKEEYQRNIKTARYKGSFGHTGAISEEEFQRTLADLWR